MSFRDILRKDQTGAFLCGNIRYLYSKRARDKTKCHNRRIAREQKGKKETEKRKQRRRYVDKTEKQTKLNSGKTGKGIKQAEYLFLRLLADKVKEKTTEAI
jgi:hypothetical protein